MTGERTSRSGLATIFKISWLNLKHDRGALALTFVLPVVFFSIFAGIFGRAAGGAAADAVDVLVVDLDRSETSRRFVAALGDQEALAIATAPAPNAEAPEPPPYSLEDGRRRVREGAFPVALVLPAGFGDTFGSFTDAGEPVELIYDAADPIARHSVAGLLQAAAMTAAPDLLMKQGLGVLEAQGGPLTEEQRQIVADAESFFQNQGSEGDGGAGLPGEGLPGERLPATGLPATGGLVPVEAVDVRTYDDAGREERPKRSIVAYYAAGIGVMFLLFSMAGAGGALLEEEESGVLERLLVSNVSMTGLLLGKWLFFAVMGLAQVTLMFVWGAAVFGLELWTPKRLAGFAAMAAVTACAAAAFGIVLATACRSRSQLSGTSTIVILIMSALGGSMMPRFIMPDFMDKLALLTFNGWALDGFLKVFWYDDPEASLAGSLLALAPQLAVLSLLAVAFLVGARTLARRWETV